jgi:hypothetical protein
MSKSAEEIVKRLSSYKWDVPDRNRQSLLKDGEDPDFMQYVTLSPEEFHKMKAGTCWDHTEAQRRLYSKAGIPHRVYYLEADNPEKGSHTIVVREAL